MLKNFLIHLLGKKTQNKALDIEELVSQNEILESKLKELEKNREQLDWLFFVITDSLHHYNIKNIDVNNEAQKDFSKKIRVVFMSLRMLSNYRGGYRAVDEETFNELKDFLKDDLFRSFYSFEFTDENADKFQKIMIKIDEKLGLNLFDKFLEETKEELK